MIGLIVARSKNNVIGKNGNIPWKINLVDRIEKLVWQDLNYGL